MNILNTLLRRKTNQIQPNLYDRIGGHDALNAVVETFYARVMQDERVCTLFEDVDVERLKRKQVSFLRYAFGGSSSYKGKELRKAHAHLQLNHIHWHAVVDDLIFSLNEHEVDRELVNSVLAIVDGAKKDVLNL